MNKFNLNSLFLSDGYKIGHKAMLAEGTDFLYGTWIPRSTKHAPKGITKIVSFGQQMAVKWLHDEFEENFFKLTEEDAMSFVADMSEYLGMPFDGEHFRELHQLGYLPIRVKALPEGIETPVNVPHMTFVNTKAGFAWLTLYLETIISSLAWKPSTSATLALAYRRNLVKWVAETDAERTFLIDFLAHDFSARGLSPWDMISSGLGHATSFRGSDTLPVIPAARYFYGEKAVVINSVNASEHSVSTTKIFTVGEQQMISDWMKVFPTGILSIVSDTFDLWKLITEFLPVLKEEIMGRDGKIVIRPDSGDPVDIICGINQLEFDSFYKAEFYFKSWSKSTFKVDGKLYEIVAHSGSDFKYKEIKQTHAHKGVIELLWDIFGGYVNEQGYKVLDPHIGAIYGDSINLERQIQIYERLKAKGFAATNIVLGVGSYTYQMNTRDTFGFAAKGAWFEAHGVGYNIYKDPVTDDGTKKSLRGRICVNADMTVTQECGEMGEISGILQPIYLNGEFLNETTLTEIRGRIAKLSAIQ